MKQTVIPIQRVIQNVDRVVVAKEFDDATELYVTGHPFLTVQGEGPLNGHVAWFVRLAGCNFGDKTTSDRGPGMCAFCDTSFQIDQARKVSPQDLLDEIVKDERYDERHIVVITGGEPTLQAHRLLQFMTLAAPHFEQLQIETNGTQAAFFKAADHPDAREMLDKTTIVVSPKATEITGKYTPTSRSVLYSEFMMTALKFLISADPESPYHEVPAWGIDHTLNQNGPVYVSPMAVYKKPYQGEVSSAWDHDLIDPVATAANYSYAAAYAIKHNLQLSIQQHLFCAIA